MNFRAAMIQWGRLNQQCEHATSQEDYDSRCAYAQAEYARIKERFPEELRAFEAEEDAYSDAWFKRYGYQL